MNSIHFRSRYIIEKEMEMVVVVVEAVVAAIKNKSKIALRVGPSHSQITVGNIASVGIISEQLEYLYRALDDGTEDRAYTSYTRGHGLEY